ncbi:hypothetical protein PMAYCL1PPCAC_20643 [Pristionchus mayeri]|uniref:Chondroitin proteoglycan 4 domain-containing protein n=1 Tax=Pristionchus mayeri TaxID=1317129 RepID=A0AAN5CTC2_9BILA|nr:hypothetical protein PMAYCL1PPCAC_20643 [Pristionchus mayeri]
MNLHLALLLLILPVAIASPRRTTIETMVKRVTKKVVHYLQPQCQCTQVAECKKEAVGKASSCFDECDSHLKSFHDQTSADIMQCFNTPSNMKNSVAAEDCLFNEMDDFCHSGSGEKYVMPSNFSEAVGFELKMGPSEDEIPDVPYFKKVLKQFKVFESFFECSKKCIHREISACFERKDCAVVLPPKDHLKPIYEKCNGHTPQMSAAVLSTCQCLAHRKRVNSLYGICPIISNPIVV